MSEITKIYIDFKGNIPEMDNVRECDWFIEVYGDPLTDDRLDELHKHLKKIVRKIFNEDGTIDYYDMCIEAEVFLQRKYGYLRYDSPSVNKSLELDLDEDS